MHLDEKAQLSMDFLGGFVIVFFCLVTVLLFLPSFFSTMQNPSIDLHPVAYRTAVLLAEDTGWWNNIATGEQGYNWESHMNNTSRIGLASSKYSKGEVCSLDGNKILKFIALYNKSDPATYEKIQDLLGLKSTTRRYNYNLTFKVFPANELWIVKYNSSGTLKTCNMTFGETIPTSNNVEKFVRMVTIKNGLNPGYVPLLPGLEINTEWYPNWPDGHPYDDATKSGPSDDGKFERPLTLTYPLKEFRIFNFQRDPSNTSQGDLEVYATTDNDTANQDVIKIANQVVAWSYSGGGANWTHTDSWNHLDWEVDPVNGFWTRDFASEINAKLNASGAVNGTKFQLAIQYHNVKGNVYVNVNEWAEDTFIPIGDYYNRNVKLEVCVW